MSSPNLLAKARQHFTVATTLGALLVNLGAPSVSAAQESPKPSAHTQTKTPIEHVIVIIGENRTFDHIFATYKPRAHETVSNLLSKGIVNEDGTPGPNFSLASQSEAEDTSADRYQVSPSNNVTYPVLPPVLAGGYTTPPFPDVATAKKYENGLPKNYYKYLTTGGTGLAHGVVDTRVPNATMLPSGPFQITSATLPYDSYTNSPVHRFYQMWRRWIAMSRERPKQIQADARPISSRGWKRPSAQERMAFLSPQASTT
jgi:phospholipase C